jgi:hypothetical protein
MNANQMQRNSFRTEHTEITENSRNQSEIAASMLKSFSSVNSACSVRNPFVSIRVKLVVPNQPRFAQTDWRYCSPVKSRGIPTVSSRQEEPRAEERTSRSSPRGKPR